jgi:hypothetical protein
VVQVIEHLIGCYTAQEVAFGVTYTWSPECVVVVCECGARTTLTASMSVCSGCGEDHARIVWRELSRSQTREIKEDKELHPWRYAGDREGHGLPY